MTMRDSSTPEQFDDQLFNLVSRCQQSYQAWSTASNVAQQEALRRIYQTDLEHLWDVLAPAFQRAARGWLGSGMASDIESMAQGMFAHIIFVLPRLKVDPNQDVRSYLIQTARNCTVDEYRQVYTDRRRRARKQATDDEHPTPGSPAAALWSNKGSVADPFHFPHAPEDTIDPRSYEAEELLTNAMHNAACLQEIWKLWDTFDGTDRQIVDLRWRSEPRGSFRMIAQKIGAGWTEAAVRQRHHRIIEKTRNHLRDKGLWDEGLLPA